MNVTGSLTLLKKRIREDSLDGFLVSKPANVSYLSGFTGADSYLLITQKKDFFITDFRYHEQAKIEIGNFDIELVDGAGIFNLIASLIEKQRLKRVGFEAKHISYGEVSRIRDRLKTPEFIPSYDLVEDFRIIKTPVEVKLIKKAARICLSVFKQAAGAVEIGKKEKEIAAFVEYRMRAAGADSASFATIVLSGKRSALPHGSPSEKRIKNNEAVLIDSGACIDGYNSDLTRVFFLGRIPSALNKIYGIIKAAQEKAIKAIRPGIRAAKVDSIAREYIKKRGFGRYFGHSLGHGIGREVHEAPSLSAESKAILRPGMVFTVEPAVYMPGLGGIRIEDMVFVTNNAAEVLSA